MLKNWCFWTEVLEKSLRNPLDCEDIKPVNPKGNQSRIFIGKTDAEAEAQILWLPDVKNWLIGKDFSLGKTEGREGGNRGWDGWMTSLTRWTWIWESSSSYRLTWKHGILQSMGSQRAGHDCETELNHILSGLTFKYFTSTSIFKPSHGTVKSVFIISFIFIKHTL